MPKEKEKQETLIWEEYRLVPEFMCINPFEVYPISKRLELKGKKKDNSVN